MPSFQQTIIIGHVGSDCDNMRYTPEGKAVAGFSVAVSKRWKDQAGAQQERATWYRVNAWEKLAETCAQYVKKGMLVQVEGEMQEPKPYQARDGSYRASLDLRARSVLFLSRVEGEAANSEAGPAPRDNGAVSDISDENVPF